MTASRNGIRVKHLLCLMVFSALFAVGAPAREVREEHNCDFAAVITRAKAKEHCLIAQMPRGPGGIANPDDPEDFFYDFLVAYSGSAPDQNPDGYRLVYYRDGEAVLPEYETTGGPNYPYRSETYYHDHQRPMENAHEDIMDVTNKAVIVMGHDRKGEVGEGNHPFTFEGEGRTWSFMHNGGIEDDIKQALWNELYNNTGNLPGEWFVEHPSNWVDPWQTGNYGDFIDSELLFHWIMKNILEKDGDALAGLYQALTAEVEMPGGGIIDLYDRFMNPAHFTNNINFVLCDGEALYVFRNTPWNWSNPGDWDHEVSYEIFDVEGGFVGVKTQDPLQNRIAQFTLVYIPRLGEPVEFPFFLDGYADTWIVPDDFATIQAAINAATDGDKILVRPGTYHENLDFLGKAITLRSDGDGNPATRDPSPQNTVIDGNQQGSVVVFQSHETPLTRLEGFTITNGDPGVLKYGGGIFCTGFSGPTLTGNIITQNRAKYGGGISCMSYASPLIRENTIENNESDSSAAGLHMNLSVSLVTRNTIRWNVGGVTNTNAQGGGFGVHLCELKLTGNLIVFNFTFGSGGAISANESDLYLTNNTIWGNRAEQMCDGIYLYNGSHLWITNTILWENSATFPFEIVLGGWGDALTIDHSDVEGGEAAVDNGLGGVVDWDDDSMMNDPPMFEGIMDFHLSADSPCIDQGTNQAPYLPLLDMDGEPRICFGPASTYPGPVLPLRPVVDMGADEFPGPDPSRPSGVF